MYKGENCTKMKKWENGKTITVLVTSIVLMLMLFYFACQYTLAWLYKNASISNNGTTNTAKAEAIINSSTTTTEFTAGDKGVPKSVSANNSITNNGTTNVLVRVFYSIYVDETTKEIATTRHFSSVVLNSGFLASEENIANTYSGLYYYNTVLAPGKSVSLVSTVTATAEGAGKTMKINMTVEMVDYTGGAYRIGYKDPWTNTPVGWFANNYTLTKTTSTTVGPKLGVKWNQVSKIELTATTTINNQNILFCTYNGAWIGISNGAWTFTQITGSANKEVTQFTSGTMTTITFTVSATQDTEIGLIWDSSWSKEVTFGQIKMYDQQGDVILNLVPDKSGKFYDKVSKAVLPMYSWSSGTATASTAVYASSRHCEGIDGSFESYTAGAFAGLTNQATATMEIVESGAFEGTKCLKLSGTFGSNRRIYNTVYGLKGKKYKFSVAYKSNMPAGTALPNNACLKFEMNGGDYSWNGAAYSHAYSGSGEWEIMTVETAVLTSDTTIYCFVQLPTGATYQVYLDAWFVMEV